MTERLYYDNAYMTEFAGTVLACEPCGDAWRVLPDRSAFYPTSGGQPNDTGTLGGARVTDVQVEDGLVWHTVDAPLAVGSEVTGRIDWARRFDHMQQHAGDHMIAGSIHRRLRGVTIGLHTGEAVSSIDVALPDGATHLSDAEIRAIEDDVNEHIQRDVPIRCWFPEPDELAALPLRKAPTVTEHVRVVAIGDDEMVACGGTHPASAGQVGLVKILSCTPARGKLRVTFVAGMRAYRLLRDCYAYAHEASDALTTSADCLPGAVRTLQERVRAQEKELNALRRARLPERAGELLRGAETLGDGTRLVAQIVPEDGALLRELCSRLIEEKGVVALIGTVQGTYVFGRSADAKPGMGDVLREAARTAGGKGGGRPDFAQGSGPRALLTAAAEIVKGVCGA